MIIVPVERKIDWRRPPLVLIALVVLNVLIFAFYQSDDQALMLEAAQHYHDSNMLDTEWRAYQVYSKQSNAREPLSKDDELAIYYIVSDSGFDYFMQQDGAQYVPKSKRRAWRESRDQLEDISSKISSHAFGFHPDRISIVQLISSQFLHGSIMHLVGNMVFLILVGFAVEAALGSTVFLLYYLLSGIGGALFYAALINSGGATLIGASGSISGVMAMYVVLFAMRKVQFFYWVFIFTGYLRAAAILMLPVYILKEVISYLTIEGSNVAFTAHIGGFLAGAVLVLLTQHLRSQMIDDDYLDNKPQALDPIDSEIEKVYELMGLCEFAQAWEKLKPIKQGRGNRADIVDLEFNLVRALHPKKVHDYLLHRLDKTGNSENLVLAQLTFWRRMDTQQRADISIEKRGRLLTAALELNNLEMAEQVFESMQSATQASMNLAVSARQLSAFCKGINKPEKSEKYHKLSQMLASDKHQEALEPQW